MKKIPLIKPKIELNQYLRDVKKIVSSGIFSKGKFINKFETVIKETMQSKFAFSTTSATTALHLSLVASGIGLGDEVLVSDFSFPASGNVVAQIGAKPVFVDIDLKTFCLDTDDLIKKITRKTKAIMVVHAFGYPADMTEIMKIARKHHLIVVEDAACAIGSKHGSGYCGTFADFGCFSFHPRKVVTTGEGGVILTDNSKMAEKIAILRNHGSVLTENGLEFVEIGYNYRMSELQAALGIGQIKNLSKIVRKRQQKAKIYLDLLKGIKGIVLPSVPTDGIFNFQSFVILLESQIDRDEVKNYLSKKGIETTLGTYAMHAQKSFKKFGYNPGDLPNSYRAYKQTLTLPLYEDLAKKDMSDIAKELSKAIKLQGQ